MTERRGFAVPLDEQGQALADEKDAAGLRRVHGDRWQVTYDASRWDGERWEARPLCNLGRDGERVTAADSAGLDDKLAELDLKDGAA